MTPEARDYPDKARRKLAEARKIAAIALAEAAAREAYLAAFLSAEALIAERTNRTLKTHAGVQGEFHRLSRLEPEIDPRFPRFLSQSFELKTNADYAVGASFKELPLDQAAAALETAREMIQCIEWTLTLRPGTAER